MTIVTLLKSRTVWAVLIGLVLTTLQVSNELLPTDLYLLLQGVFTALAVYFRANPQVVFPNGR